jgi:L-lactate dehydrogenase complex protein LldE
MAVVRVLRHLGVEVDFPLAQTCCGQPTLNAGFLAETRQVAAHMIDVFDASEYVVTPSGSCCSVVREHYPHLFDGDPDMADRADRLAGKTYEFIEFLLKVLKVDIADLDLSFVGQATYHFNCHLRGLGMSDEAIEVMRKVDGLEYLPMEKHDQCCGFGGLFAIKYDKISEAIVEDKAQCILKSGANMLVCNDAGCTMNINGFLRRRGSSVRCIHIAEILDEAIRSKAAL